MVKTTSAFLLEPFPCGKTSFPYAALLGLPISALLGAQIHAEPAAWRRAERAGSQAAWEPQLEQDAQELPAQALVVFSQELEEPAAARDETLQDGRRFQRCAAGSVLRHASHAARRLAQSLHELRASPLVAGQ